MSRNNKRLDKLVVIDLEATCDDPRPTWRGEIIEVGVCLLDLKTLEITKERGILVKPERTPVTEFCTFLTTITPELIEREGVTLSEAMKIRKYEYRIHERSWVSWGDYDRNQLNSDCDAHGVAFPGKNSSHLNIKNILAVEYGWPAGEGLDRALELFNMELLGTHHRGVDDAVNVARIFTKHLERVRSL